MKRVACALAMLHGLTALAQTAQDRPVILSELSLSEFEHFALTSNPTLAQAAALVKRSGAQARQASLLPNPSIGYEGDQIRGGEYGGGEQGAFVQQNFILGGKLGLRRNVYQEQGRAAELALSEQRYRVLGEVDQRFYSALAAQATVNLRKQLRDIAQDAALTAHQLANVGQADVPDVLQAEVEAGQADVAVMAAERVYVQEFKMLSYVAGKPDLPVSPLAGDLEQLPTVDADKLLETATRESPSVKAAEATLRAAEAQVRAARHETAPDLVIRAGMQQNNEHLGPNTNTPVGAQGFASAGITLPLFDRNQGNVMAAEADLERARSEVTRAQLMLREMLEPLAANYRLQIEEANRYRSDLLPRAEKAYQLYSEKYRQMALPYPQVIVSQRTLFELRLTYVEILRGVWQDAVGLQNFGLTGALDAARRP